MRRKFKNSTGRKRRSSRRPSHRPGRRPTPSGRVSTRGAVTRKKKALSERRASRPVLGTAKPSRSIKTSRPTRNRLPDRPSDRPKNMLRDRPAKRQGLSSGTLQIRRANENASGQQTRQSLCTRTKQTKRAVIIATGYGGINNQRNYRSRKPCGAE